MFTLFKFSVIGIEKVFVNGYHSKQNTGFRSSIHTLMVVLYYKHCFVLFQSGVIGYTAVCQWRHHDLIRGKDLIIILILIITRSEVRIHPYPHHDLIKGKNPSSSSSSSQPDQR